MPNDEQILEEQEIVETPEDQDEPDYDTLKARIAEKDKTIKTLDAQRLHWKSKADGPKDSPKKAESQEPQSDERYTRLELKVDGYSDEEVDFLMPYGGKKALDNPFVKAAITSMREEKKIAQANSIKGAGGFPGKEKEYTEDDISHMSSAEIEKGIRTGKIKTE